MSKICGLYLRLGPVQPVVPHQSKGKRDQEQKGCENNPEYFLRELGRFMSLILKEMVT